MKTAEAIVGPIRRAFAPSPHGHPKAGPRALDCSSADIRDATPDELVKYLSTHEYDPCLRFLWQLDANLRTVLTDSHVERVAREIAARSPSYDGTNASHLREIIGFQRVAYYHDFYHDDLDFSRVAQEARAALNEFAKVADFNVFRREAAQVLLEWINAADGGGFWKTYAEQFRRILGEYIDEASRHGDYWQVLNSLSVAYSLRRPPVDVAAIIVDPAMLGQMRRHSLRLPVNDYDLVLVNNMIWTVGTLCRVPEIKADVVALLEQARSYHATDTEPYYWAGEALNNLC